MFKTLHFLHTTTGVFPVTKSRFFPTNTRGCQFGRWFQPRISIVQNERVMKPSRSSLVISYIPIICSLYLHFWWLLHNKNGKPYSRTTAFGPATVPRGGATCRRIQCCQQRIRRIKRIQRIQRHGATRSRFLMLFATVDPLLQRHEMIRVGPFGSQLSQFGHDQNNCNIIQNLVEEIGRVLMMNNSIRIWNRRRVVNPKPGVADHTLPMLNFRMTGKHFYVWGLQNI